MKLEPIMHAHPCFHFSRFGMPARTDYRLTVENLSSRVSWQVRAFPYQISVLEIDSSNCLEIC